jgi:hypothetical protein
VSLEHRLALVELALIDIAKVLAKMRDAMRQQAQLDLVAAGEADGFQTPIPRDTTALRGQLVAMFERITGRKYVFEAAKDAMAMKRLVDYRVSDEEVCARWSSALRMRGYPGTTSLAVFAKNFNAYPGGAPHPAAPPVDGDPY